MFERCSKVNCTFRDAIRTSPLLQHKIDLYAAGLEYNLATEFSLTDSRNAFAQYCSNLDSLCPIEKKIIEIERPDHPADNKE